MRYRTKAAGGLNEGGAAGRFSSNCGTWRWKMAGVGRGVASSGVESQRVGSEQGGRDEELSRLSFPQFIDYVLLNLFLIEITAIESITLELDCFPKVTRNGYLYLSRHQMYKVVYVRAILTPAVIVVSVR